MAVAERRVADFDHLNRLIWGLMPTQCLYVVAKLGVADAVAAGPRPVADVAREVGADPDALERIVRALVAMGVFERPRPGWVGLNSVAELLVEGPGSARYLAMFTGELTYPTWANMLESATAGGPVFERLFGAPFFEWLSQHPDQSGTFNRAMEGSAAPRLMPLLARDWSGVEWVIDVGGGNGAALRTLLAEQDHLRGTVFDLPGVADAARGQIEQAGLAGRCDVAVGSFFEQIPAGGDVYLLAQILHDWDDGDCLRILGRVRDAMADTATLLVLELIVPGDDAPHPSKLIDLQMMVLLGGRERTLEGWRRLLGQAGFDLASVGDGPRSSVIEARPARP